MTHVEILRAELEQHGRTTYRELMAAYGGRGYRRNSFAVAARRLRRRGIVRPASSEHKGEIVRADACPCCGRAWKRNVTKPANSERLTP